MKAIAHVTYLVREYDEAIDFFTRVLGFSLLEDTPLGSKRWVLVGPRVGGVSLLLARAATPEQEAQVGKAAGGRVAFFLHTDDFAADHAAMKWKGVQFIEEPRHEVYGTVVVFLDLYGNKWDLVERREGRTERPSRP